MVWTIPVLTIGERTRDDGSRETVTLGVVNRTLVLCIGDELPRRLPDEALLRVMARYGRPLAPGLDVVGPSLELDGGRTLRLFRHLARYDVIARDYLVIFSPGEEPLAELAIAVTGALVHLARAGEQGHDAGG